MQIYPLKKKVGEKMQVLSFFSFFVFLKKRRKKNANLVFFFFYVFLSPFFI